MHNSMFILLFRQTYIFTGINDYSNHSTDDGDNDGGDNGYRLVGTSQ